MSTFQEKYFNEENRLRNAIIFNEEVYNKVFHGVNNIFNQKNEEISNNVTSINYKNKNFIIIEKNNNLNLPTLFVFCFKKNEKINISNIQKLIEQSNLMNSNNFVLSVKKRESEDEHINVKERVQYLKDKMSHEENEKIIFMVEHLKSNFLLSNNYLSNVYDFYTFLNSNQDYNIDILSISNEAEKDNIDYGNKIVKGLIERIKLIKSVCTNKYEDVYNHKIKIQNGLLVIKNENSCFAIEQNNEDVSIYDIHKGNTLKEVSDGKSGNVPYRDTFMKMENGKIVYFEKQTYDRIVRIVIQNLYLSLLQDKKIKEEDKTDKIMTYEYQKNLYCYLHNASEAEFVASALLNGSGFKYNKEHFSLYASNYGYIEVKKSDINNSGKDKINISYINNASPLKNNMYVLSEEWKKGIEVLLNCLKEEKPLPKVHYGKTPIDSVDEAIEYCQELINFGEQ